MRHCHDLPAIGLCLVLAACGGSADSSSDTEPAPGPGVFPKKVGPPEPVDFVVSYLPEALPGYPQGRIILSPPPGATVIDNGSVGAVRLLLFGEQPQNLTAPNGITGEQQLSYVFKAPESLRPGAYRCVPGTHRSQIQMTNAPGVWQFGLFELCPGVAVQQRGSLPY